MKKLLKSENLLWCIALAVIFTISFSYTFDSKLNLNGDNCYYFANATSLAKGAGYADMFGKPTTNFPPGYPLLMTPLRMVTDSIVAQKVLNGLFLLTGVLLLFSTIVRAGFKRPLAFLACTAVLITPHLLEFTTMMMSEASCFCCIALIFWLYQGIMEKEKERSRSTSSSRSSSGSRKKKSAFDKVLSSAANTIGREVGKQLVRGLLGSLKR